VVAGLRDALVAIGGQACTLTAWLRPAWAIFVYNGIHAWKGFPSQPARPARAKDPTADLDMTNPPLVTFVVLVYNQEGFVRDAVISALAQTYSPLEIIVSDDASRDGSVATAQHAIAEYSGPHSPTLNVNARNLGIGAHVNEMFRRARGELIVLAGGDDISHPERTSYVVQRWLDRGKGARAIFCGARGISPEGMHLGHIETELEKGPRTPRHLMTYKAHKRQLAIGACGAYSVDVMRRFGALASDLPIEDIPLLVRASMLDGVEYIDEDLVDYRINVSVWRENRRSIDTFEKRLSYRKFYTRARLRVAKQLLRDALSTGRIEYIRAARAGYAVHNFVYRCCEHQRMYWKNYLGVALASGNWLYPLAAGLMDGYPKVHRFAYRHFMTSASKRPPPSTDKS
jgi:glycosyltransferase involved in cell wall biosynthesis